MLLDLTGGVSASHAAAILAKFLPSRGGVVLPYGKSSVKFMCRLSPATLEPCSFPFVLRLCVHSELLINVNSGWEPSPWGNDAFPSISDRILNKGQVSLEFNCLCCSWIKVKTKKERKGGLASAKLCLNGNGVFSRLWEICIQIEFEK